MVIESAGRLEHVPQARLLREVALGAVTVAAVDNIFAQAAIAKAGAGLVSLPCYLGRHEPELVAVLEDSFRVDMPVWLLTRNDLRQTARVRAVLDFIADEATRSLPQDRARVAPKRISVAGTRAECGEDAALER